MITITLAQLNVTVGDMDGNLRQMIAAAQRAQDDGANLVVFSELSLTGYYPGDLLDEPHCSAAWAPSSAWPTCNTATPRSPKACCG